MGRLRWIVSGLAVATVLFGGTYALYLSLADTNAGTAAVPGMPGMARTVSYPLPNNRDSFSYAPLIALAVPLSLSSDQQAKIAAILQQGQQDRQKLLQASEQERSALSKQLMGMSMGLSASSPLMSNPVTREATRAVYRLKMQWERRQIQSIFQAMNETHKKYARENHDLELKTQEGIRAVLNEKQKAALPFLLATARDLQTVSIPVESYTALNLTDRQKAKIADIADTVPDRQRQIHRAFQQKMRAMPPILVPGNAPRRQQTQSFASRHQRVFRELNENITKLRRDSQAEALALLTPDQRQRLSPSFRRP